SWSVGLLCTVKPNMAASGGLPMRTPNLLVPHPGGGAGVLWGRWQQDALPSLLST
ncbi:hypothetical protein P7K49_026002, partial [Saguinus oedipus]